jgi:hypothetical protein
MRRPIYIYLLISRSVLLRMRNVSENAIEKIKTSTVWSCCRRRICFWRPRVVAGHFSGRNTCRAKEKHLRSAHTAITVTYVKHKPYRTVPCRTVPHRTYIMQYTI